MIRNVKRKLNDPHIKSFKSVATGIMGIMRRRTFMAIFWISDVAFKVCIYHVNYLLYYCFYTNLRPGGRDFRKALVINIKAQFVMRNSMLKLTTIPVWIGFNKTIDKLNMMLFFLMTTYVWARIIYHSPFLTFEGAISKGFEEVLVSN